MHSRGFKNFVAEIAQTLAKNKNTAVQDISINIRDKLSDSAQEVAEMLKTNTSLKKISMSLNDEKSEEKCGCTCRSTKNK